MRRLLLTTAALTALAPALTVAPAALAQDQTSGLGRWLALFDPDLLVQRALQSGIMVLRTQLDLTYGGMTVDLLGGKITLTEISAWPLPDWDDEGTCEVGIDQLVIRTSPFDDPELYRLKAQILGAAFPTSCLPPDLRGPLDAVGVTELTLPRVTVDMAYGLPNSDLKLRAHADLEDLATVDLTADFAYFWFDVPDDFEDPIPILFLDHAALSLENQGVFARVSPLLPPPLTGEGAGAFVEGALSDALTGANGGEALSAAQQGFVASVAEAWPAFLANPETLVLETTNDGDVFLDVELIEDDPRELFDPLMPVVALRSSARAALLPGDLLLAAMEEPAALSLDDRKRVGLALVTGEGAPRNVVEGVALLEGLAEQNDGESAAALARAAETAEPEAAYRWALIAGVSGQPGIAPLLDRLEARLGFATMLELQAEASEGDRLSSRALQSVAGIRSEAARHLSGKGRKRSFERAAVWAMLGAAAGDAEAADILADLSARAQIAGPDAIAALAEAEQRASQMAMEAWLDEDLAARFAR
jgi:TPR repeat protein